MVNMVMNMNKKVLAKQTIDALESFLMEVHAIRSVARKRLPQRSWGDSLRPDAIFKLSLKPGGSLTWVLVAQAVPLTPKVAELTSIQVKRHIEAGLGNYGIVTAPYISPRSAEILRREGIGSFDLSGNCLLVSGPLYLERGGHPNEFARKETLRSLFAPAAERILRALLDPVLLEREWTLRDLAAAAYPGVSLGQAHKVRVRLGEQALLSEDVRGTQLREPKRLLDDWSANYRFERNGVARFYSPLQLGELKERFLRLVADKSVAPARGLLASFTAAEIIAPQVRQFRFFAYWKGDATKLIAALELKAVLGGDNVVIYTPYDDGVFYPTAGCEEPVTGPVQTYLDLRASAARGVEAAGAVFEKYLKGAYEK